MIARPAVAVPVSEVQAWISRAAAVIDRLTAENARLRAALEPFARHSQAVALAEALGIFPVRTYCARPQPSTVIAMPHPGQSRNDQKLSRRNADQADGEAFAGVDRWPSWQGTR